MALRFGGVDFLEFDSLLSEDERMVRATARQFVEDSLIPIIAECNRQNRFPSELIAPMGKLGSCRSWSGATADYARLPACRAAW
jgi:glutaryl-CoA dehydrogenase